MIRKYLVLLGVASALSLLFISTLFYPGGSQHDEHSVGFRWQHNYLSNLLNPVAVNGEHNAAQPWAIAGLLCLCIAVAVFFIRFAEKLPSKHAERVVKYAGAGAMLCAVFTATPYHDAAVMICGTLLQLSIFYITVFMFKSRLHFLKILSVLGLSLLYVCSFIYYTRIFLEFLPIVQKVSLLLQLTWVLALEYGVRRADFSPESSET